MCVGEGEGWICGYVGGLVLGWYFCARSQYLLICEARFMTQDAYHITLSVSVLNISTEILPNYMFSTIPQRETKCRL